MRVCRLHTPHPPRYGKTVISPRPRRAPPPGFGDFSLLKDSNIRVVLTRLENSGVDMEHTLGACESYRRYAVVAAGEHQMGRIFRGVLVLIGVADIIVTFAAHLSPPFLLLGACFLMLGILVKRTLGLIKRIDNPLQEALANHFHPAQRRLRDFVLEINRLDQNIHHDPKRYEPMKKTLESALQILVIAVRAMQDSPADPAQRVSDVEELLKDAWWVLRLQPKLAELE